MNKSRAAIVALTAFTTGLLVQTVLGPRRAVAQGNPRKWEQYCSWRAAAAKSLADEMNRDLKDKGLQGWELVTMTNSFQEGRAFTYYCFKRPQ